MKLNKIIFTILLGNFLLGTVAHSSGENDQGFQVIQKSPSYTAHASHSNNKIVTTEDLQIYFSELVNSKALHQIDIAEALFVSPSTISEFIKLGQHSQYVFSQFKRYRQYSGLDLSEQRIESDKIPVTNFEEIELCLNKALSLPLMPSELRKPATLQLYFRTLLDGNPSLISVCDRTLHLNGQLGNFLSSANPGANFTRTVYSHLLSYYRGTRLIMEDRFQTLESLVKKAKEDTENSFLNWVTSWSTSRHKIVQNNKKNS